MMQTLSFDVPCAARRFCRHSTATCLARVFHVKWLKFQRRCVFAGNVNTGLGHMLQIIDSPTTATASILSIERTCGAHSKSKLISCKFLRIFSIVFFRRRRYAFHLKHSVTIRRGIGWDKRNKTTLACLMMRQPKDAQKKNDTAAIFFLRLFGANAHTRLARHFFNSRRRSDYFLKAKISSTLSILMYRANRAALAVAAKKLLERTNSL